MIEANKALVRRWFQDVWNDGREESIDKLFAIDGVAHGLGDGEADVHGPVEFKPFVRNLRGSFPDIHFTIDDIVAEDDKVVVRVQIQGTHQGAGLGVAPTGARINVAGMVLVRVVKGQIVEGWNSYDQLGLLRQIGVLPVPGGPDRFLTDKA